MIDLNKINKCVINLPHRPEKLKQVTEEINTFFDNKEFQLVNGVIEETPHKGIAQAHMNCIKLAKANNWENVLIMEDDLQFRQGAKEYANKAFLDIPSDFNILLGGLYSTDKLTPYNEFWQKTSEFCGLQFYIVNANAYDTILNFKKNSHIDRFMAVRGELKCYVTNKFFAIQRAGHSDNVGMYKDYTDYLKDFNLL